MKIDADRIEGAIASAIIGDVLGWPQERPDKRIKGKTEDTKKNERSRFTFKKWYRRSGTRFNAYVEEINAGEYSDDSQLLLMTARSILKGASWSRYLAAQEMPLWLLYERGGGNTVLAAARSWAEGIAPWSVKNKDREQYFRSGANGAIMRILPHALLDVTDGEMLNQVMLNSALTHGHPRAILSSLVYALGAKFLLLKENKLEYGELITFLMDQKGLWSEIRPWPKTFNEWMEGAQNYYDGKYEEIWDKTIKEIELGLTLCEETLQEGALASTREFLNKIGALDKDTSGSGIVALLSSVYVFSYYVNNYHAGLLELAFADGADTDTLSSLTAGLFGCFWGKQWLHAEWFDYQDSQYVKKLAGELSQIFIRDTTIENGNDFVRWTMNKNNEVIEKLLRSKVGDSLNLGILGDAEIIKMYNMEPIVKKWAHTEWKIKTETGQTIYISKQQANHERKNEKQKYLNIEPTKVSYNNLLRDINNILLKYGVKNKITQADLIVTDQTVSDMVLPNAKLSDIITDYYWQSISSAVVEHYTSKESAENILNSESFRLSELGKRYNEGEIRTFCKKYGLDGYLRTTATEDPLYKDLLIPNLYFASFAKSNLSVEEEEQLWNRFTPAEGVRLKMKVTAQNPDFRKIFYERVKDKYKDLLNELSLYLELKHNRKLILKGISTLCAFFLSENDLGLENEYRILYHVRPGFGPQPKINLIDNFVELPLNKMTEAGFKLEILEVYSKERPSMSNKYKFIKRQ